MSDSVVCKSNAYGEGCGHPITDHVGNFTTRAECCCCTQLSNVPTHVDTCLDCSILHGKRRVRLEQGKRTPLVTDVEPFIPDALKRAFWQRYMGKYFDRALGA